MSARSSDAGAAAGCMLATALSLPFWLALALLVRRFRLVRR